MHTSPFTSPLTADAKEQAADTMAKYLARPLPSHQQINAPRLPRAQAGSPQIDAAWTPPPSVAEIVAALERATQLSPEEEAVAYKALLPLLKRAKAVETFQAHKRPAQPFFKRPANTQPK